MPDGPTDFLFTAGRGLSDFTLDDDDDPTPPNQVTFDDLEAGTFTITESASTGFGLTGLSCTAGGAANLAGRTATVTLAAGTDVTCSFVNARQGEGTQGGTGGPVLPDTAVGDEGVNGVVVGVALLALVGAIGGSARRWSAMPRRWLSRRYSSCRWPRSDPGPSCCPDRGAVRSEALPAVTNGPTLFSAPNPPSCTL